MPPFQGRENRNARAADRRGGLPEDAYAEIADKMTPLIREAKGFIYHAGGPNPAGGWRVIEICESEEDGQNWFGHNIKPNLPPGAMPKHTYYPLRTTVTK